MERTQEGFEHLRLAVKHHLKDTEMILNHDMLAYMRIQEPFVDFVNTGFTKYDVNSAEQ